MCLFVYFSILCIPMQYYVYNIYTHIYIYMQVCICIYVYMYTYIWIWKSSFDFFPLQPFIRWNFIKLYHVTLQEPHWMGLTHRLGILNRHVLPWELILKNTHIHKLAVNEKEEKMQGKLLLGTNTQVRHWPLNISQLITRWNYL